MPTPLSADLYRCIFVMADPMKAAKSIGLIPHELVEFRRDEIEKFCSEMEELPSTHEQRDGIQRSLRFWRGLLEESDAMTRARQQPNGEALDTDRGRAIEAWHLMQQRALTAERLLAERSDECLALQDKIAKLIETKADTEQPSEPKFPANALRF